MWPGEGHRCHFRLRVCQRVRGSEEGKGGQSRWQSRSWADAWLLGAQLGGSRRAATCPCGPAEGVSWRAGPRAHRAARTGMRSSDPLTWGRCLFSLHLPWEKHRSPLEEAASFSASGPLTGFSQAARDGTAYLTCGQTQCLGNEKHMHVDVPRGATHWSSCGLRRTGHQEQGSGDKTEFWQRTGIFYKES